MHDATLTRVKMDQTHSETEIIIHIMSEKWCTYIMALVPWKITHYSISTDILNEKILNGFQFFKCILYQ